MSQKKPEESSQPLVLTGIKPSGTPHLGNYMGAIRPSLELAGKFPAAYFMADYHALTTVRDPERFRFLTHQVAATWLALGLDPEHVIFFRQSDIPEVFELTWILSCFTGKGLLNRAHAYKAAVQQNRDAGNEDDWEINAGLYYYPVLMAADILAYGTDRVPVGQDQKQHLEMTRDIAGAVNHAYGEELLKLPEPLIAEDMKAIPGIDGRKMSKSYDNVIPIFAPPKELKKRVMQIVTDSKGVDEPKDPDSSTLFEIYRLFAPAEDVARVREGFLAGGLGYGEVKKALAGILEEKFGPDRERYGWWMDHPADLEAVLRDGAERARARARPILDRLRGAMGVGRVG